MKTENMYHMLRDIRSINGFKLDSHHKSILFCLESRGKKIYPSYKTLAADSGCLPRTAQRKINDLKNQDIIKVEIRIKDKKYTSNKYLINRDLIQETYYLDLSTKDTYPA